MLTDKEYVGSLYADSEDMDIRLIVNKKDGSEKDCFQFMNELFGENHREVVITVYPRLRKITIELQCCIKDCTNKRMKGRMYCYEHR
jgi:hypothetical protein